MLLVLVIFHRRSEVVRQLELRRRTTNHDLHQIDKQYYWCAIATSFAGYLSVINRSIG